MDNLTKVLDDIEDAMTQEDELLPCDLCKSLKQKIEEWRGIYFLRCEDCGAEQENGYFSKEDLLEDRTRKAACDVDIISVTHPLVGLADFAVREDYDGKVMREKLYEVIKQAQNLHHLQTGWRSIESAPKDGQVVLCVWPNGEHYQLAKYMKGDYWFEASKSNHLVGKIGYTHWMPLPDAPTDGGEG